MVLDTLAKSKLGKIPFKAAIIFTSLKNKIASGPDAFYSSGCQNGKGLNPGYHWD